MNPFCVHTGNNYYCSKLKSNSPVHSSHLYLYSGSRCLAKKHGGLFSAAPINAPKCFFLAGKVFSEAFLHCRKYLTLQVKHLHYEVLHWVSRQPEFLSELRIKGPAYICPCTRVDWGVCIRGELGEIRRWCNGMSEIHIRARVQVRKLVQVEYIASHCYLIKGCSLAGGPARSCLVCWTRKDLNKQPCVRGSIQHQACVQQCWWGCFDGGVKQSSDKALPFFLLPDPGLRPTKDHPPNSHPRIFNGVNRRGRTNKYFPRANSYAYVPANLPNKERGTMGSDFTQRRVTALFNSL